MFTDVEHGICVLGVVVYAVVVLELGSSPSCPIVRLCDVVDSLVGELVATVPV